MQIGELAQEHDERALAERVRERCVERNGGVLTTEYVRPARGDPGGDEVAFVQHEHQMLVACVLCDVALKVERASTCTFSECMPFFFFFFFG